MDMMKYSTILACLMLVTTAAFAQERDNGSFSAGLETNTTYYLDDSKTGASAPEGHMGSNNYLKMDYSWKGFYAGVQLEGYLPALSGYFPMNIRGENFLRYDAYAGYSGEGWDVRLGSLYEQFGSGLLFRTYEDRTLGINNALQGVRAGYTFGDFLTVKAIYGRVRDIKDYTNAMVSGADLSFSVSRAASWDSLEWTVEGSVLDKYEHVETEGTGAVPHNTGYSARMALGYGGFRLSGEYMSRRSDPGFYNYQDSTRCEAVQVDFGYTGNGFGGLLTFRKLKNPFFQGYRSASDMYTYINYVPALTQQHSYALATLNPYTTQFDETGGQADLYYNFRRGTTVGGRKGMKIHANFSTYYGGILDMVTGVRGADELLFRDLTIDAERWFERNFKMILFYSWQTFNPATNGHASELWNSHTVVADMTYKFDRKNSLRMELQHLYTKEDQKNWAAILLEYSFAPRWSVSLTDMWNYGDTGIHYVNGNVSYSYGKIRAAVNAGRFKEGYLCSGGVCRLTPAYTGVNLSLVVSL